MSDVGGADQPPVKKLKRGDDETGTINVGGPMEDEENAHEKLEELGFSTDDLEAKREVPLPEGQSWTATAMMHFCRSGDLKMCRFLLAKGASVANPKEAEYWSPLLAAVIGGKLHVCEWLFEHLQTEDLKWTNEVGKTPLFYATCYADRYHQRIAKWMILNGAVSFDSGEIDREQLRKDFVARRARWYVRESTKRIDNPRVTYWFWADSMLKPYRAFSKSFLLGTVARTTPPFTEASLRKELTSRLQSSAAVDIVINDVSRENKEKLWNELFQSPVRSLAGNVGILSMISDYAGVFYGKKLRILSRLTREIWPFDVSAPQQGSDVPPWPQITVSHASSFEDSDDSGFDTDDSVSDDPEDYPPGIIQ